MKIFKLLSVVLAVTVVGLILSVGSGFDLKYLVADIVYRDENPVNGKIIFSKNTGFYDEEFYLNIYAPSKEIYYTLDGSEPTKESLKYNDAILINDATLNENTYSMRNDVSGNFLKSDTRYKAPDYLIDKCTVLKVAYYDKNGNRSNIEERVFFVSFEEKTGYDNVNIISITGEPEDFFGDDRGIYVLGNTFKNYCNDVDIDKQADYLWKGNFSNSGKEWERKAQIQIFDRNKQLVLSQSVGVRIQGGVSRSFYPKSLNIYAREEYGSNRMMYDFFGTGYYPQRITLSSGGNDYYSKLKDRLGAELTRDCNFSTMHYEPYVLFLNGEYWGFYYMTEKYDENYIEHYYGIEKDNVVIIKQGGLEAGTSEDRSEYKNMMIFMELADMTIEDNYQKACELMDMESFIEYYAAEIYMARNADWPSANYALWRSRETSEKKYEDGKWRWMLFDVNTSSLKDSLAEHDTLAYVIDECALFANLSRSIEFQNDFSTKLREMRDRYFEDSLVNEKLDEYKLLMNEPMEKYFLRFFGISNEEFHERRRKIREFNYLRKDYIEVMLENNGFI